LYLVITKDRHLQQGHQNLLRSGAAIGHNVRDRTTANFQAAGIYLTKHGKFFQHHFQSSRRVLAVTCHLFAVGYYHKGHEMESVRVIIHSGGHRHPSLPLRQSWSTESSHWCVIDMCTVGWLHTN